ncbi:mobilization protein [Streptomyces triculaminicus]|uniref:mobilization protein n=1 Tax=Streptomyces triculaminicus TaxID=2816232 RepID=UPI0037AA2CFF
MIPKAAKRGKDTAGLLYYLWGPGKANEHTDPHMIAAWDDSIVGVRDPARSSGATVSALAYLLDAYVDAMDGNRPAQHVYHVPVSLGPDDRILSDAEWAEVACEIMDAAGIAPKGDSSRACRWVAMRHADNHIHIVATLATLDGRVPNLRRDWIGMQDRARDLEKRLGLRQLRSGDKTAKLWLTTAEVEKTRRYGREESPRVTLQRRARLAASAATSEPDFFARLARSGVRVQRRMAPDEVVTGYSVALPGDRTADGRAVWFSGSRLAPDLSLPRVRERWAHPPAFDGGVMPRTQAEAWAAGTDLITRATHVLAQAGDAVGAGAVAALGDLLTAYAAHAPLYIRDEIQAAAAAFERAGRAPAAERISSDARQYLQAAAQYLALGSALVASGGEGAVAAALLAALVLAVLAAYRWHQARDFVMQARAAETAGQYLRAAEEVTRGASTSPRLGPAHQQKTEPAPDEGAHRARGSATARHEAAVRAVLPALADQIVTDQAWPALGAMLDKASEAGYEPAVMLAQVAGHRELGTADSVAQVLAWRLQGRMRRDAQAGPASAGNSSMPTANAARGVRPSQRRAQRGADRTPPEHPRRGHHR